ncbi:Uncharacterized protein AB751O23_BI_00070 [Chlamydiales bacterium SCGC AB-751-O23]|jgi:hypothetical protein|nr:Uncharacterized protein AB751O23_BI_00070 [Chlamydiales bacterium SCGC AB-751-O23]
MSENTIPSFFTPIKYDENHQKTIMQSFQEGTEAYFSLYAGPAYVISGNVKENSQEVEIKYKKPEKQTRIKELIVTALKVASYITFIIPLVMLVGKIVFRVSHKFHFASRETEKFSKQWKIPSVILPIKDDYTLLKSITEQRAAHETSKTFLVENLKGINAKIFFVSPAKSQVPPKFKEAVINKDLDPSIFTWENSQGVQGDIQRDGKIPKQIVLYGVASQFNSCEATGRFTPPPGKAVELYQYDKTQGPGAQLQFPDVQVEIINNAANLGFNGLCQILNDKTKAALKHGYLTPIDQETIKLLINQLQKKGNKAEFPCIGNIPKGTRNTEIVYQMLVAAPAFGMYTGRSSITSEQKSEIEFLCALNGYRAQFQQAIHLAKQAPKKQVIFKPTAPGLGVFGNKLESVSRAFYIAAKENEKQLKNAGIQVKLQVFRGKGDVKSMAETLGLSH